MVGEWIEKTLGDLIDIKHGYAFKGEFFRDEPPGDILLTPGNFAIGGGFKADTLKYYDGPVPDEFILHESDLIVTMTDLSKNSDTLGYPAFIPPSGEGRRFLHNQRLGKVVAKNREDVDLRYLHYLLCSREYRHEVIAGATGTTVKHTSPERIKKFRFLLPPLPEQRAIAHILGTLDDKIELNRQMNRTLEA
ncbi:restriction endonuclease subunit S, partial [bacterium]|nr:restriction endonuclease subunit S [bacterium]